ncbi:MAG: hypothetical protein MZV64_49450 [Ignavibacteriales bacterium]|nr:hypothetical protein [Ignavibacteriales bacterium]
MTRGGWPRYPPFREGERSFPPEVQMSSRRLLLGLPDPLVLFRGRPRPGQAGRRTGDLAADQQPRMRP